MNRRGRWLVLWMMFLAFPQGESTASRAISPAISKVSVSQIPVSRIVEVRRNVRRWIGRIVHLEGKLFPGERTWALSDETDVILVTPPTSPLAHPPVAGSRYGIVGEVALNQVGAPTVVVQTLRFIDVPSNIPTEGTSITVSGLARVAGNVPFVRLLLTTEDGRRFRLVGSKADAFRKKVGEARVTVTGRLHLDTGAGERAIEVETIIPVESN